MNHRPFRPRLLLWLLPFLLIGGVAWNLSRMRERETGLLQRAESHFRERDLEGALQDLAPLRERRMLSVSARRRAALLFFQLGEDREAHRMLLLQKPDPNSLADRELRDWAGRCQRAQQLLARANSEKDPNRRRGLIEEALGETPDSPALLQRLVREDLLLMTLRTDPQLSDQFARDYQELKSKAPQAAAAILKEAKAALDKLEP